LDYKPREISISFLKQKRVYYSVTILRSEIESYNWEKIEGIIVRITLDELEKTKWEIYDEIIEDLGIK